MHLDETSQPSATEADLSDFDSLRLAKRTYPDLPGPQSVQAYRRYVETKENKRFAGEAEESRQTSITLNDRQSQSAQSRLPQEIAIHEADLNLEARSERALTHAKLEARVSDLQTIRQEEIALWARHLEETSQPSATEADSLDFDSLRLAKRTYPDLP